MHRLGRVVHNARGFSAVVPPNTSNANSPESLRADRPIKAVLQSLEALKRKIEAPPVQGSRQAPRDSRTSEKKENRGPRYSAPSESVRGARQTNSGQSPVPGFAHRLHQRRLNQKMSNDNTPPPSTQPMTLPDIDSFPWHRTRNESNTAKVKPTDLSVMGTEIRKDGHNWKREPNHIPDQQVGRIESAQRTFPRASAKAESLNASKNPTPSRISTPRKYEREEKISVRKDTPYVKPVKNSSQAHRKRDDSFRAQPGRFPKKSFIPGIEETDFSKLFRSSSVPHVPESSYSRSVHQVLESVGGDYSRHLPSSLNEVQQGDLTPSQRAQLALARRRDVGLQGRNKISKIVEAASEGSKRTKAPK